VTRRPLTSYEQNDAFTGWRKYLHWHRGELRKAKRRESKLDRRRGRDEIRQEESHE